MSCGCKTSGDSSHSCGTKSASGCSSVDTCGNSYKLSVFDWLSDIQNPKGANACDFVEVRFKNDRKYFFKNTHNLPLNIGSIVTLEASPGHDIGVVSLTGELVRIQMKKKRTQEDAVLKVYRLATQKDIEIWQDLRLKENDIKVQARKIAYALNLEMKITDVEYQGDGSKVTIYYTADARVDFRQLIKEYASLFRTKIDMKQIGFRQESAKVGGIGSCGRELCCSTWLTDFRSVNTNAARYQQLSINPQKLAGQCGKLKCCLNFELDTYMDVLKDFPSSNTVLNTEKGKAFCIKIDVFKKKMWFAYVDNSMAWYDLDTKDVKTFIKLNKEGKPSPALEDVKVPDIQVMKVDLIQENSLDRFEKKNRPKSNNNNNQRNKPRTERPQNTDRTSQKPIVNQGDKPVQSEKPAQNRPSNSNPNQKGTRPQAPRAKGPRPDQASQKPVVKADSSTDAKVVAPQGQESNQPAKKNFNKKYKKKPSNNPNPNQNKNNDA
ncbi:PSP1 domain-containing protein [Chryseobacterium sp. T1]